MKERPVIYKSRKQVTLSPWCVILSVTLTVSMGNHHMHKNQMHAQIPAHRGAIALFMSPALTLCV